MPKISIITATYNSEKYIVDTYNSIANQDFSDWEWVVTDDCSTDTTLQLLNQISQNDNRVRIFSLSQNYGAAIARNHSLDKATGEYLAFIDSDDRWRPNKLSKQLTFMEGGLDFSFTGYEIIQDSGKVTGRTVDTFCSEGINYVMLLKKHVTLGCSTVILKKEIVESLRMPNIRTGQDYAFWLNILKEGNMAHCLPDALTEYRVSEGSISRNKFKKARRQWEIYRKHQDLKILHATYYYGHYVIRALFRRK